MYCFHHPDSIVADTYFWALQDEIDYFEGDEYIPAKDWAARQKARVESTWDHEGLPPSSLYSEVPPWPESMPGSSDNLGGQEPTTSHAQNPQVCSRQPYC